MGAGFVLWRAGLRRRKRSSVDQSSVPLDILFEIIKGDGLCTETSVIGVCIIRLSPVYPHYPCTPVGKRENYQKKERLNNSGIIAGNNWPVYETFIVGANYVRLFLRQISSTTASPNSRVPAVPPRSTVMIPPPSVCWIACSTSFAPSESPK